MPIVYIPGFNYENCEVCFDTLDGECEDGSFKGELLITFKTEKATIFLHPFPLRKFTRYKRES